MSTGERFIDKQILVVDTNGVCLSYMFGLFQNGVPIENTSTYFRKGSQWLIIRYVNLADLGNYSCYVNNSLGHVESDLATLSASNATGES